MKRLVLLTVMLAFFLVSCSGDIRETEAETAGETVSVTTSQTATELSETTSEVSVETTTETVSETLPEKSAVLSKPVTVKPRELPYHVPVMVFEDRMDIITEEENFPCPEHISLARKTCFEDEETAGYIEDYNDTQDTFGAHSFDVENFKFVENPEDIEFSRGVSFDFDKDGEAESVLELRYTPSAFMGGCAILYCDGGDCTVMPAGGNPGADMRVLDYGEFAALLIRYTYGYSGWDHCIFTFDNGVPETAVGYYGSSIDIINTEAGGQYFLCTPKYALTSYPVVCWGDGVFRQVHSVQIDTEQFTEAVENGDVLLDEMADLGMAVDKIYTTGYYDFWLCYEGGEFYFSLSDEGREIEKIKNRGGIPQRTDESDVHFTGDNFAYELNVRGVSGLTVLLPKMEYDSTMPELHEFTKSADIDKLPSITEYDPMKFTVREMTDREVFADDTKYESVMQEVTAVVKSSENYRANAEILKSTKGMYILGDYPWTADTDENYEPVICFENAVKGHFDDTGEGYAVTVSYEDIHPEFTPYKTEVCVYVDGRGKGHMIIEKAVNIRTYLLTADRDYILICGGTNNVTGFCEIYDLRDGIVPVIREWRLQKVMEDRLEFIKADVSGVYYCCFDKGSGKFVLCREAGSKKQEAGTENALL